jgi:sorbitol-specific phosphotransferase system component IIBC
LSKIKNSISSSYRASGILSWRLLITNSQQYRRVTGVIQQIADNRKQKTQQTRHKKQKTTTREQIGKGIGKIISFPLNNGIQSK